MADDDVISDHYVAVSSSSTVDIQPASGDEWAITWIASGLGSVAPHGDDGSSDTGVLLHHAHGDDDAPSGHLDKEVTGDPTKFLINNGQFLNLEERSGVNETVMYSAYKVSD